MKTVKTIIKIFLFSFILVLVCQREYNVLSWKDTPGIETLYTSEKDSIDVIFIGSSHSFCSLNTGILWNDYGIASKNIGDSGQRFPTSYYYLLDALKTQNPKVVFIELWGIEYPYTTAEGSLYRNTIGLNWSRNYVNNLNIIKDLKQSYALF